MLQLVAKPSAKGHAALVGIPSGQVLSSMIPAQCHSPALSGDIILEELPKMLSTHTARPIGQALHSSIRAPPCDQAATANKVLLLLLRFGTQLPKAMHQL